VPVFKGAIFFDDRLLARKKVRPLNSVDEAEVDGLFMAWNFSDARNVFNDDILVSAPGENGTKEKPTFEGEKFHA